MKWPTLVVQPSLWNTRIGFHPSKTRGFRSGVRCFVAYVHAAVQR